MTGGIVTDDRRTLMISAVFISLLTAALLLLARSQGITQPLELTGYDLGLALRPVLTEPAAITLIEITEDDIQSMGRWPVTDSDLARIINRIDSYGPRVIGIDIYRDVSVPPGTDELANTFESNPRLIGIMKFHSDSSPGVAPPAALAREDRVGFSDLVLDPDGTVRRGLAFLDDGEQFYWAFSLKIALAYLAADGISLTPDTKSPEHFRLGPTLIPPIPKHFGAYANLDNAGYQFLADNQRQPDELPTYPLGDLLSGTIDAEQLRDRVVILGVNAQSVKDSFVTPLSRWSWNGDPQVRGVALHGLLVDQMIRVGEGRSAIMSAPGPVMDTFLMIVACLAGGISGLLAGSATRLTLIVAGGALGITATGLILFVASFWLPVLAMTVGWSASACLVTAYLVQRVRRERHDLKKLLNVQVSPQVAEEIWQRRGELLDEGTLKPKSLTATVMFVDLQGFTRQTERLPSESLLAWLQPFLTITTETVLEYGGMVDDYFGDGVKANFGVPFRRSGADIEEDARNAIRCALELTRRLRAIGCSQQHPYAMRFGVHSGAVVAGTVGSRQRSKYTTIGDTVNVAARLEATAKDLDDERAPTSSRIVASAATLRLLENDDGWEPLGSIALKGRREEVSAFVLRMDDVDTETGKVIGLRQRPLAGGNSGGKA
jgi:adenylate cyclase